MITVQCTRCGCDLLAITPPSKEGDLSDGLEALIVTKELSKCRLIWPYLDLNQVNIECHCGEVVPVNLEKYWAWDPKGLSPLNISFVPRERPLEEVTGADNTILDTWIVALDTWVVAL